MERMMETLTLVRCMECGAIDFTDDALRSKMRGGRCPSGDLHGPTQAIEYISKNIYEFDAAVPLAELREENDRLRYWLAKVVEEIEGGDLQYAIAVAKIALDGDPQESASTATSEGENA